MPEPTASQLVAEGGKVLLDEKTLWPDGQFVITNVVVSQSFLKEHPDVVEAVLHGSVDTNAWIKANPDQAKTATNAQLQKLTGKALPRRRARPGLAATSRSPTTRWPPPSRPEADHAVQAGLLQAARPQRASTT